MTDLFQFAFGPSIGGIRMAPDVSIEECVRLARSMTLEECRRQSPPWWGKSVVFADRRLPLADCGQGAVKRGYR